MEKHAETAWASLSPDLRSAVTVHDVREGLAKANLRAEHGENNQVFIAREADGQLAGYIWVGRNKSGFTGVVQAHILNVLVEEEFRGQGIGVLLMSRAEDWAREHQLKRIGLSVSVSNTAAIGLYEKLAYETETLRMVKNLEPD